MCNGSLYITVKMQIAVKGYHGWDIQFKGCSHHPNFFYFMSKVMPYKYKENLLKWDVRNHRTHIPNLTYSQFLQLLI